ncbi:MAG: hypothetical protein ACNS62_22370 [Candidatus Cyclobacteriaceae bacterium M3_2C_046]
MKFLSTIILVFYGFFTWAQLLQERGEVGTFQNKFIWTGTGQAFVPNYFMIDVLADDLGQITDENLDQFIQTFMHEHGFNGLHVPVYGQWFHIGDKKVTSNDSMPDPATFARLEMIIRKVYQAGGAVHLWAWGDHQRSQTARSTKGGIMGTQEKRVMDMIARRLGPLPGWTMGYGFDLFEWVNGKQLKAWHDYMWAQPGWNHLLGARANKNELNQISEVMDYASYEYHKPWYEVLRVMITERPKKPAFSEDRYRIRNPSKYPEKDYNEEETRRGLWHHTMAGGVAAIWGNLVGDGTYSNQEALKTFFIFWNDHQRFKKDMVVDNRLTDGYGLRVGDKAYVFYKEHTTHLTYEFAGNPNMVVVVDTRQPYQEIPVGIKKAGQYTYLAPYESDWAIAVE